MVVQGGGAVSYERGASVESKGFTTYACVERDNPVIPYGGPTVGSCTDRQVRLRHTLRGGLFTL